MNERINELVLKARGQATSDTKDGGKCFDLDLFHKKFAELIVRECMNKIQEVRQIKAGHPTPDYEQGMNDGMFVAIRTIEEHFGVEE